VFVCILPGKAVPEMTYTASGGTLNPTHSLTPLELRKHPVSRTSFVVTDGIDLTRVQYV